MTVISNQGKLLRETHFSLLAYSFSHFTVDFSCFYLLYALFLPGMSQAEIGVGFLLYNILAFGLQPFLGYFCDSRPAFLAGRLGAVLTGTGVALGLLQLPWLALITAALGNAWFHVAGGIDSLVHARGKLARSGVFVSTGAVGVVLGTLAGQTGASPLFPLGLLLLALLAMWGIRPAGEPLSCWFSAANPRLGYLAAALALAAIVIRAYGGGKIPMDWKTSASLGLLPGIFSCLGKAAGGLLADRVGVKRFGALALLLSIPLLCFGGGNIFASLAGVFLFNTSMPVSLCTVASLFPHSPGLAFGLTTLALLCGTVPLFFFSLSPAAGAAVLGVLTLVSALFTLVSTQNNAEKGA